MSNYADVVIVGTGHGGVELVRNRHVTKVDPRRKTIEASDGSSHSYGKLIWAAGGGPRRLVCSGHDLRGVHYMRSRADIDRIRLQLSAARTVVIIGGGYIGLESAAGLVKLGKFVTVLERLGRVLERVTSETLSRIYEREHRDQGVDVRVDTEVLCLQGDAGWVQTVCLTSGETIPADMVIVGVGIVPNIEALADAGASFSNGVQVDECGRTSLEDIFAVGDCASYADAVSAIGRRRLESIENAVHHAEVVANFIVRHDPPPPRPLPWFWSIQYDLHLQTVGLFDSHDRIVKRGSVQAKSFSLVYLKDRRVIALDCVNSKRDFIQGRALIADGSEVREDLIADSSTALKSFCRVK